jgi:hypothetical protein
VITAPGFRDETTQVLWLQTRTWYADLRVPADRPGPRTPAGFGAYAAAELLELAKIQGFAGELSAGEGICLWRRDFDRQPPGPVPDEARYAFDGPDVMIEDGVHADYQEIWRREPASAGPFAAFRLVDPAKPGGLLVAAGDHLMEFLAHPGAALSGGTLAELVSARLAAGDRAGAEGLLETRIRYARRDGEGWRTRLSSHPWLEDKPMWPAGGLELDVAAGRLRTSEDGRVSAWGLLDADVAGEALRRLLTGAPAAQA